MLGRRRSDVPPTSTTALGAARRAVDHAAPGRLPRAGTAVLLAAAAPAPSPRLTPGSSPRSPSPERCGASRSCATGVGAGRDRTDADRRRPAPRAPGDRPVRAAVDRLADGLVLDPEVLIVASGRARPTSTASGRYARVIVAGRHEYGAGESRDFVRRLRTTLVPAARFPAGAHVAAGGAPPQGVDFLARSYGAFPWLVLAVLVLTYVVLLRAFRSLLLPLKAVLLNLLTVAAVYGLLASWSRWHRRRGARGRPGRADRGLDPDLPLRGPLRALDGLRGLHRHPMREAWDGRRDNARAVALGLERTGRIVTAAALIMVAAFSGFVAGPVAGLRQLGLGLALGVLLDATIVRSILVPSLMA